MNNNKAPSGEVAKINKIYVSRDFKKTYDMYVAMMNDYPNDFSVLHNLGIVCIELKRYEEAAKYLIRILDDRPDSFPDKHPKSYWSAAYACVYAGNMIKAKEYIEVAYAKAPNDEAIANLYKKILDCNTIKID